MYLVGIFGLNVDYIIKVLRQLLFTQTSQLNILMKSSCMLSSRVSELGAFSGGFPRMLPCSTLRSVKVFMGLARFYSLKALRRGGECEGARTLC